MLWNQLIALMEPKLRLIMQLHAVLSLIFNFYSAVFQDMFFFFSLYSHFIYIKWLLRGMVNNWEWSASVVCSLIFSWKILSWTVQLQFLQLAQILFCWTILRSHLYEKNYQLIAKVGSHLSSFCRNCILLNFFCHK